MGRERIKYLDIASGIMIVWVLLFHALYPLFGNEISNKIPFLYFFMPWFFYKSGYMFDLKNNKKLFSKDFKKLILPFVFWSVIGYIAWIICCVYSQNLTFKSAVYTPMRSLILNGSIPLNNALWFIPVLCLVRVIANTLLKKTHPITVCILTFIVAITCNVLSFRLMPHWIYNTAWGLFFFMIGFLLKKYETKKQLIVCCTMIFVISLFTNIPLVYSTKEQSIFTYLLWYPCCACGCVVFNNFCRLLVTISKKFFSFLKVKSNRIFPIISYVGKNSISFYLPHYIVFRLGSDIIAMYQPKFYSTWEGLVIICFLYVAILFPISELRKKTQGLSYNAKNNH